MSNNGYPTEQRRPLYERDKDLREEESIASIFSRKFECTFSKMPIRYGLDYAIVRSGVVCGFAEFKSRTNAHSHYQTYMLSLGKVMSARMLTFTTTLPCFLMVKWTDAIGYIDLKSDYELRVGGRTDRSDWQDVEPVAHFSLSKFRMLR